MGKDFVSQRARAAAREVVMRAPSVADEISMDDLAMAIDEGGRMSVVDEGLAEMADLLGAYEPGERNDGGVG